MLGPEIIGKNNDMVVRCSDMLGGSRILDQANFI